MSRSLLRAFPLSTIRPKPAQFLPIFHHISHLRLAKSVSRTQRPVSSFSASATHPPSSTAETIAPSSNSHSPFKDSLQWINRTAFCGELSVDDVGKRVRLCGWVALHRVHGGLTFLNLRDHSGIVQVLIFMLLLFEFLGLAWNWRNSIVENWFLLLELGDYASQRVSRCSFDY